MKKWFVVFVVAAVLAGLVGCGNSTGDQAEAPATDDANGITVQNAFYYTHVNGHREETQKVAFVLFEYEQLATVKYQVAYLACTCRPAEVNYYSVAYVELSKEDGSIKYISYDRDSAGHYNAGLFADSSATYEGVPNEELFAGFIKNTLMGASQESINAFEAMHGDVDTYTGATVTPNNAVSMLKGLFEYHNARYM